MPCTELALPCTHFTKLGRSRWQWYCHDSLISFRNEISFQICQAGLSSWIVASSVWESALSLLRLCWSAVDRELRCRSPLGSSAWDAESASWQAAHIQKESEAAGSYGSVTWTLLIMLGFRVRHSSPSLILDGSEPQALPVASVDWHWK